MPKIDFCFQGWVRGANIHTATNKEGKEVDVSWMSEERLAQRLNEETLTISLGDHLYKSRDAEIEIFDFAAANYGRKITPSRLKDLLLSHDARTMSHVQRWVNAAKRTVRDVVHALASGEAPPWSIADEQRFRFLADSWREETEHLSNVKKKSVHPMYQQIIGMGRAVLPLIFADLKETRADWFWALTAITGENPIEDGDAGNINRMTEAWLRWARAKGYSIS